MEMEEEMEISGNDGGRRRGFAISVLHRRELLGPKLDHSRLADGPSTIHAAHEFEAGEDPAPWRQLGHSPIWNLI
jgi:hypothetical protein